MTLDEAIKHCHEKAEEIRKANEEMPTDCKLSEELCECANEHEQLAEWLEDYKRLLEEKTQGDSISREGLKNYARTVMYEKNATNFSLLKVFDEIIDNVPTVETSKIEHKAYNEGFKDGVEQGIKLSETPGEWIEDSGNIACSHCHTIWLYRRTDFCPNCGADMRGNK